MAMSEEMIRECFCDQLEAWGCDVTGALERCLDDKEFYVECLEMLIADENFELLGDYLKAGDSVNAFNAAHTLKGIAGNMGITPMMAIVSSIVEPLVMVVH